MAVRKKGHGLIDDAASEGSEESDGEGEELGIKDEDRIKVDAGAKESRRGERDRGGKGDEEDDEEDDDDDDGGEEMADFITGDAAEESGGGSDSEDEGGEAGHDDDDDDADGEAVLLRRRKRKERMVLAEEDYRLVEENLGRRKRDADEGEEDAGRLKRLRKKGAGGGGAGESAVAAATQEDLKNALFGDDEEDEDEDEGRGAKAGRGRTGATQRAARRAEIDEDLAEEFEADEMADFIVDDVEGQEERKRRQKARSRARAIGIGADEHEAMEWGEGVDDELARYMEARAAREAGGVVAVEGEEEPAEAERDISSVDHMQRELAKIVEPGTLKKTMVTGADVQIAEGDVPERLQLLWGPAGAPEQLSAVAEEATGLSEEAEWIYARLFGNREETGQLRGQSEKVLEAIGAALRLAHHDLLEVPTMATYRKELVGALLEEDDFFRPAAARPVDLPGGVDDVVVDPVELAWRAAGYAGDSSSPETGRTGAGKAALQRWSVLWNVLDADVAWHSVTGKGRVRAKAMCERLIEQAERSKEEEPVPIGDASFAAVREDAIATAEHLVRTLEEVTRSEMVEDMVGCLKLRADMLAARRGMSAMENGEIGEEGEEGVRGLGVNHKASKAPSRRGKTQQFIKLGLGGLALKMLGRPTHEVVENLSLGYLRHVPNDVESATEASAEAVVNHELNKLMGDKFGIQEGLRSASHIAAALLGSDPVVREVVRKRLWETGTLSTGVTPDGMVAIDAYHELAPVRFITEKPLGRFTGVQALLIEKARSRGWITVDVNMEETAVTEVINELYSALASDKSDLNAEEWNEERRRVAEEAVREIMLPSLYREAKGALLSDARDCLREEVAASLWKIVSQKGFSMKETIGDSEGEEVADLRVLSCCVGTGEDAHTFVALNPAGDPVDHLHCSVLLGGVRADGKRIADEKAALRVLIEEHKPHVVCFGVHSYVGPKTEQLKRVVKGVMDTINEENPTAMPHNVEAWTTALVDERIPRLWESSRAAVEEMREKTVSVRRATCLGRMLINPLAVVCSLMAGGEELLHTGALHLHPLIGELSLDERRLAFERVLVTVVNQAGCHLNDAFRHAWLGSALPFVSGLGVRKALGSTGLLSTAAKSLRGQVQRKAQLLERRLLGPRVFANAAGFLAITAQEPGMTYHVFTRDAFSAGRIHPESLPLARRIVRLSLPEGDKLRMGWEGVDQLDDEEEDEGIRERELQSGDEDPYTDALYTLNEEGNAPEIVLAGDVERVARRTARWMYGQYFRERKEGNPPTFVWRARPDPSDSEAVASYEACEASDVLHGWVPLLPTVRLLMQELSSPFADPRAAWAPMNASELFERMYGESLSGSVAPNQLVLAKVTRLLERDGEVELRLESGAKGLIRRDDLSDTMRSEDRLADRTRVGAVLQCRVKQVVFPAGVERDAAGDERMTGMQGGNFGDVVVHLQTRSSVLADTERAYMRDFLSQRVDPWYSYEREQKAVRDYQRARADGTRRKARGAIIKRMIDHPMFRNLNHQEAMNYFKDKDVGDFLFRPSSQGLNSLDLSIKLRGSQDGSLLGDMLIYTIKINEYGKDANKKASHLRIGSHLMIGTDRFDDLDEVVAMYVEPFVGFLGEARVHRKFNPGNQEQVSQDVKEEKKANPSSIPYYLSIATENKRTGRLSLTYHPHKSADREPRKEDVQISPKGFRFREKTFHSLDQMIGWFKKHMRDEPPRPGLTPAGATPGRSKDPLGTPAMEHAVPVAAGGWGVGAGGGWGQAAPAAAGAASAGGWGQPAPAAAAAPAVAAAPSGWGSEPAAPAWGTAASRPDTAAPAAAGGATPGGGWGRAPESSAAGWGQAEPSGWGAQPPPAPQQQVQTSDKQQWD